MTYWRAVWRTLYPFSDLRPRVLDPPYDAFTVTRDIPATGEAEALALIQAQHPDAFEVRVALVQGSPETPGNLPPAPGTCERCGSIYKGAMLARLHPGPTRRDGAAFVVSRICPCANEPTVRFPVFLPPLWVRLQFNGPLEFVQVVHRSYHGLRVKDAAGKVWKLRTNGTSETKSGYPFIPPEDLAALPPRIVQPKP